MSDELRAVRNEESTEVYHQDLLVTVITGKKPPEGYAAEVEYELSAQICRKLTHIIVELKEFCRTEADALLMRHKREW